MSFHVRSTLRKICFCICDFFETHKRTNLETSRKNLVASVSFTSTISCQMKRGAWQMTTRCKKQTLFGILSQDTTGFSEYRSRLHRLKRTTLAQLSGLRGSFVGINESPIYWWWSAALVELRCENRTKKADISLSLSLSLSLFFLIKKKKGDW
jgi:hypothetical protein